MLPKYPAIMAASPALSCARASTDPQIVAYVCITCGVWVSTSGASFMSLSWRT